MNGAIVRAATNGGGSMFFDAGYEARSFPGFSQARAASFDLPKGERLRDQRILAVRTRVT